MKKILSLVMAVVMLVAVLAFVGCADTNKNDSTTTAGNTTAGTTTEGTTTAGTTTEGTTTEGTTTEGTTTEGTTTAGTTTEGTTTAGTTTEGTTTEGTTTEETTLPNVFARFDFGTASKGQDLGMTSHEYLVEALEFDAAFINVTYTEDSIIVTAVQDHPELKVAPDEDGDLVESPEGYAITSYALCYEDLTTFDFDDELKKDKNFMKFRIKNNTTNNIMSFRWHKPGQPYATTLTATCMYLQGGAPNVEDYVAGENRLTCEPSDVYKTYTYDINFIAAMGRHNARGEWQGNSYVHMAYNVGVGGSTGSNNWNWMGTDYCSALEFFVLGAYGSSAYRNAFTYGDTRANIVAGATVEIDYIIFGEKGELKNFTSYIEDESISVSKSESESISIVESISASISESEAAATATTAAAA